MKKYLIIVYKGKHFVIQDKIFDPAYDYCICEIKEEELTDKFLIDHLNKCVRYGIPPYIGDNKELKKRIDFIGQYFE